MPHPIEPSTLRILTPDGKTVGTGFLVAKNLVVTCAHIISSLGAGAGDTIDIRFTGEDTSVDAFVLPEYWHPDRVTDIAMLQVDKVPDEVLPLQMGRASESKLKNDLYTFGYATAADEQGIGGLGTFITLKQKGNFIQFRMHEADHGDSGAPIYDNNRGVVVGMLKKGHNRPGRNAETTFAIPTETIWRVCPQLKPPTPILPRRNPIFDGINLLPYDYDQRIQNFLGEYLGSDASRVPFGGRDDALQMLNDWLSVSTPYLLLAAPAGRGKSALLVRWLDSLSAREDLALAFVPISIRFGTNMERVFYAALAARLAYLYGDDVPTSPETSTADYRRLVNNCLSKPLTSGRTLLVVLDGLDEASTDQPIGADFLPSELPNGVRVAVSTREDSNPISWLNRLNWEHKEMASAPTLKPLDKNGVRDVLSKMGYPLNEFSRKVDIVAKLHDLSEGDPLLVSLYVSDLWAKGAEVTRLKPEDLADIKPGYKGYFDRWWEDQRKLWKEKKPWLEKHVRTVRNVLATALGSLFMVDIHALEPELESDYIADALDILRRFIIGNNQTQGYTFSHPKLGQYFWDALTPTEQAQVEERFLAWGERTLQEFIAGKRDPKKKSEVPAYVVRNYGAHLARGKQPIEKWLPLIHHQQWAQAWFTVEGAYGGYAQDVHRAWEKCRMRNQEMIEQGEEASYLGEQIRCGLIEATLHSLAGNAPNELIVTCLKLGVMNNSEAISIARQKPDLGERAICLAAISDYLPTRDKNEILTIALENITTVEKNDGNIDLHLEEIVEHIPPESQELLVQSVVLARKIKNLVFRVRTLCSLSEKIPQQTREILTEAITVSLAIENYGERAMALEIVVRKIPITIPELIDNILNSIKSIQDENDRVRILLAIVQSSSLNSHNLINRILEEVSLVGETSLYKYSNLIRSIADRLSVEDQSVWKKLILIFQHSPDFIYLLNHMPRQFSSLWLAALVIIRGMQDNYKIIQAMKIVAPNLPTDARDLWLDLISSTLLIEAETDRLHLFETLIRSLPANMIELWVNALNTAEQFKDPWAYTGALIALTASLPSEFRDLWGKLLDLGYSVSTQNYSHRVLVAIAEHLPLTESNFLTDLLNVIGTREDKALLLATVASRFSSDEKKAQALSEAFQTAHSVKSDISRVYELSSLLKYLPSTHQYSALAETIPIICIIEDTDRTGLLERVLGFLPLDMSNEWNLAVSAVSSMNEAKYRELALKVLIKHLPPSREDLFLQVITLADSMSNTQDRVTTLCRIIERLSPNSHTLYKDILSIANAIEDARCRLDVLRILLSHVSVDDTELWHQLVAAVEGLSEEKKLYRWDYFDILDRLVEYLPAVLPDLWTKVLDLTSQLEVFDRSKFLSIVAAKLPRDADHLWKQILDMTCEIKYSHDRSLVLHAIADNLPSNLNYLYRNAIEENYEINDANYCAQTLLAIVSYLSKENVHSVMVEMLASLNLISDEKIRLAAIKSAAKNLSVDHPRYSYEDLLQAARLINDEIHLIDALLVVVPYLPERMRYSVLKEALKYSKTIKYKDSKAKHMLSILLHFSGREQKNILVEAIRIARTEQFPNIRILLLIKVVETLKAVNRPFWDLSFEQVFKILGNKNEIPSRRSLMIEAIATLQSIEDDTSFNFTLGDLCICLRSIAPSLLGTTVKVIQESDSKKRRAYGLAIVADYLPVEQQSIVLTEALDVARTIEDGIEQAYVLRTIASNLPFAQRHAVLAEALGLAKNIQDNGMRTATLRRVIQQASPEDQELFLMGLDMARKIEPKDYRVKALVAVAKNLPLDQRINVLDEALVISQTIQDRWEIHESILEVAKALPATATELQQKVLRITYNFGLNNDFDETRIINILETLIPCWIEMFEGDSKAFSSAFSEVLKAFSNKKRSTLLKLLTVFAPVIYQIGGEKSVLASAQSILDTSQWWA
jgi:hypothetical protein